MGQAIFHGLILAFGLILPLGVQNVFIFNQGAQNGWLRSIPVILTASLCDTILITLAVLGVSALVLKIGMIKVLLSVAGLLFLLYMGWLTWKSKPVSHEDADRKQWPARRQVLFALSVSLLNPHAILDTIGVIGTSSLAYTETGTKIAFTLSCILISWIWFASLAFAGKLVGQMGNSERFQIALNKVSAIIMWASGIYLITSI